MPVPGWRHSLSGITGHILPITNGASLRVELRGRVALVTGGGRRLGPRHRLGLAERGMTSPFTITSPARARKKLRARFARRGGKAECFQADLPTPRQPARSRGEVAARFGRLDVLVNSAGIMKPLAVEETTPALWDKIMALNLRAAFFWVQGAFPALGPAKGKVVNLADVGGLEPWPRYSAHCVSKAGVVMLTKVLARALAPDVTVNAIAPGAVLPPEDWGEARSITSTRRTPLKRLGSPAGRRLRGAVSCSRVGTTSPARPWWWMEEG